MADRRPNILWLMTDEQRTDSLGCYGSPWARTPNLDRLAAEGTVFRRAVTPAPVCIPARLAMLTGTCVHQTGVWFNTPTDRTYDLLTRRFVEAGYRTGSFGKHHYATPSRAFETEEQLVLSDAVHYFHYAEKYPQADYDVVQYPNEPWPWIFGGRFPEPAERTTESISIDRAIDWLARGGADRPWLLRVSFNGPHTPVAPPAPFDTLIDPAAVRLPPQAVGRPEGEPAWLDDLRRRADAGRLNADQVRRMRQCYYGEVAFLDSQFGRLLDWMRGRGMLENTIVAFVADHGTHLGDYRMVQKQTFYEPSVCVPFFLWRPAQVAGGAFVETPVETLGLLPALLELAGLGRCEQPSGRQLLDACAGGGEPAARQVFSEFTLSQVPGYEGQRIAMVRDGRWKLSLRLAPALCDLTLHDLEADPHERTNLAGRPAQRSVQERLAQSLLAHLAS
jgi:arylsulfatase A-like enzyme